MLEKDWPASMREGGLKRGMTYEMIAWLYGWPSFVGSVEQLKTRNEWDYVQPKPHELKIFFRNGKVISWLHN